MSAKIQDLHDIDNTIIYPTTVVQAVYMPDQKTTIYDELESMRDESYTLSYPSTSTIRKTYTESGMYVNVSFGTNTMTEICYKANGREYWRRVTTYGSNGNVTVDTVYREG